MNEIEHDLRMFEELVPHGEESFMVLKAHLLAEHSLAQYVTTRVPSMVKEIEDRNSPVRSGLALILLAQAISLRDEIPPACSDKLWPALKALNTLRNDLAHNLFPNTDKVINRMKEFVRLVSGESVAPNENLNRSFHVCAQVVIGYLAIDRHPMSIADIEICPA
jgi:hypothetical protein